MRATAYSLKQQMGLRGRTVVETSAQRKEQKLEIVANWSGYVCCEYPIG